ncbi:enoyl-CoA hydratase/3-hydroxyacyl-CoA dehydrogenase [Marchantia polymorpha subsp. ruderalis]|uniref:3-hydroxyacyl-CoA dehydrogenase n=2 Tax=Marchantia polymorpha TaxID=3197 RepID=A0AAF6BFH7_MARPO|nr:hypothetical protein MARPO_0027s0009 [Marchantia polymorpha]PTQ42874.1 hypothetical protein MARPO_0027s0009 [Marchantia polymorpha]BBN10760.1 hypothetical protein Mp_5g06190 [Marchantia polymorpha subsp. ruderalis]BBN10761.1 hypothetical protein Mp_5g06190 [Marchantia polymorpha subsp. ruderalis]|eukprot:PTQ42873.1 hypothetical protein MARPO_0027s0009 [Marchantia polymorpha]
MARPAVTMEVGDDGVAIITIDNPPVNSISDEVMQGVTSSFKAAHLREDVKAIVLTGANGKFCGGGEIRNMQARKTVAVSESMPSTVTLVNDLMEGGPKPAVAAIDSFALGGGLEYAMICHARLATPKTKLGLPELQLGIIPGLGGTQRLPRLVGVGKAIDMMLTVKFLSAMDAHKSGLVDAVVPAEHLILESRKWALDIANGRKPWRRSLELSDKLGSVEECLKIINDKRVQHKKLFKNVPHPSACLDVVEQGILHGGCATTFHEAKVCAELQVSPTAKGLMHAFFSERSILKVPGVTDQGLKPRRIRRAAIVGGGMMGSGIATNMILQQIPVLLKETDIDSLNRGIELIKANIQSQAKRGLLSQEKIPSTLALVKGTLDYKDFGDVDIVIEAVYESLPLKQQIFQDLERYCKADCILASNTSNMDLNKVGAKISCQNRVIGTHFFCPAHIMPLVELVRTEKTSPQVQVDLINFGKVLKKIPLMVNNFHGFAINRIFFPYGMSSHFLAINLGVHPYRIDTILKNFGMPMGHFRMMDLTGIQIGAATDKYWRDVFPHRVRKRDFNDRLKELNRLGEKTGKGYYNYKSGSRKEEPAPELLEIMAEVRQRLGLGTSWKEVPLTDEEVLEMVLFPTVNEACRVLEEGVVLRASDLDLATILGMGFPRYRGGIIFWGDYIGSSHIHSQLSKWSTLYGEFYKPCLSLQRAAATNSKMANIVKVSQARL